MKSSKKPNNNGDYVSNLDSNYDYQSHKMKKKRRLKNFRRDNRMSHDVTNNSPGILNDDSEISNLKHFVNVLTNHRKSSHYNVNNTNPIEDKNEESKKDRVGRLINMMHPKQYMKPLLRKRKLTTNINFAYLQANVKTTKIDDFETSEQESPKIMKIQDLIDNNRFKNSRGQSSMMSEARSLHNLSNKNSS